MKYEFKVGPEVAFAALTAVCIFLLQVAAGWDPLAVSDWREWAVTLLGGAVRAAAGGALAFLAAGRQQAEPHSARWPSED